MSFACPLNGFLQLLISVCYLLSIASSLSSLQMKELLFVERRTHSSFELVKEFFNRTLLPLCDFTANVCDINCCRDPDCSEENIEVFGCSSRSDALDTDPTFSDPYYCYNNSSSVDPVLCYEIENSPYLGTYFLEERIMKRKSLELYLEKIASSSVQKYFDHIEHHRRLENGLYKYGVALNLTRTGYLLILPNEVLGKGYCSYNSPVRYLLDTTSICSSNVDVKLCGQNPRLNLRNYFEEDDMGQLHLPEIYSGDASSFIEANVRIVCSPDINEIEHLLTLSDIFKDCDDLMVVKEAKLDSSHKTCLNVVKSIDYTIIWQTNFILSVDVTVVLSDVTLDQPVSSLVPSRKNIPTVVFQTFNVNFDKKRYINSRLDSDSYFQNDRIILHRFT